MHYGSQSLLISFSLLPNFFGNVQLVSGGLIPPRKSLAVRDVSVNTVDVPGWNLLAEYVYPSAANVKRDVVAVPIDQLDTVLQRLQAMEEDVLLLINEYNMNGHLDSTDPSTVFMGDDGEQVISISSPSPSSMEVSLPSSVAGSAASSAAGSVVPDMASATSSVSGSGAISTAVLQTTVVASEAVATVTGDPENTSVAASSTAIASALVPSGFLPNTAAPGTAAPDPSVTAAAASGTVASLAAPSSVIPDPDSAPGSSSPSDSAASMTHGAIFAQETSSGPVAVPSSSAQGLSADSTSEYIFNAQSSRNVAVYFGQTPATGGTTLAKQCADPSIDIVILAFVIAISDGGPYPKINFGAACGGQTAEMRSKAPGLLSCTQLASDIATCQSKYGKKVLLSIGGAESQISFSTASSASTFANTMWNLFGPPGNVDIGLRPFGTSQIDGFDVDNEDDLSANWATFATTLRAHYAATKTKKYYLSSAPQCPFPDASNPQAMLLLCDFVWVQFYNNPACQIGSKGFPASLRQWSSALLKSTMAVKPKLYLGAPAFSAAGASAYAAIGNAKGMQAVASVVENMGLSNFGGVMFWDGPEGMLNTYGGKDILTWAKVGLAA